MPTPFANDILPMPDQSSEIRWFAPEKALLWAVYTQLPEPGVGNREPDRTDFYLRSNLINTGVKVREGNHEFKLRSAPDEPQAYGVVEHWMKWRTPEPQNILNTIDPAWLGDWIAIEKVRYKKKYAITEAGKPVWTPADEAVTEGCGIEFTELYVPSLELTHYTFGLEAFGSRRRANLMNTLAHLPMDVSRLAGFASFGYPAWLGRLPV